MTLNNDFCLFQRLDHLPMIDEESENTKEEERKDRSSTTTMIQFTKSISAINSMSLGLNVLKAKNKFLRALAVRHLTQADYRKEGEIQWENISDTYSPKLTFGNMDFSDLALLPSTVIPSNSTLQLTDSHLLPTKPLPITTSLKPSNPDVSYSRNTLPDLNGIPRPPPQPTQDMIIPSNNQDVSTDSKIPPPPMPPSTPNMLPAQTQQSHKTLSCSDANMLPSSAISQLKETKTPSPPESVKHICSGSSFQSSSIENQDMFQGTPPPPPPPVTIPLSIPIKRKSDSPKTAAEKQSLAPTRQAEHKLMKFHWRPIKRVEGTKTIWSNLPEVKIDTDDVITLFQVKEKEQRKVSDTFLPRTKILNVLDPRRSNQINIAIKNFPAIANVRDVIVDMNDKFLSRDGIEKLQTLIPTEDEIHQIKQSHQQNPDIPLGQAEQFLLILASISNLDCRLKLWMFKLDFKAMELDICYPLKSLMESVKEVKKSETFALLISITLNVGNMLNNSQVKGFQLDSLLKLSSIKDNVTRKSLLHFVVNTCMDTKPDMSNMERDFKDLLLVAKTDFDDLKTNLDGMENECKNALGYLKLAASYDKTTQNLVEDFLKNAARDIISVRLTLKLVLEDFSNFLNWLGFPSHAHQDYPPNKFAAIIFEFAKEVEETKMQILAEKRAREKKIASEKKSQEKTKMKRHVSMIHVDQKPMMNELMRRFSLRSPPPTEELMKISQKQTYSIEEEKKMNLEDILNCEERLIQRNFKGRKTGSIFSSSLDGKRTSK